MKKIISSVLSTVIALSCLSTATFAETTSTETKTIEVAPFTTVAAFKASNPGAEVVNVDGTVMADTAYATENVFAKIDGELCKIDVEYPYDPIHTYGKNYRQDGDVLFEKASANFNSTVDGQAVMTNSGFAYATSGYKLGDASGAAPAINSGARTLITKQTEDGEPVYVIQNNAPRYAFLRSHYSSASYESQTQSALTDITKGKVNVTTVTFKADKMGNVSLHHNAGGYATAFKGDAGMERFTYSGNAKYIPNAVHFTQDGTIKVGGTYTNGASATDRTPAHTTAATWEAGKEYTVSVVQKLNDGGSRYGYVYGIYVNGEKIFPQGSEAKDASSHFSYSSSKAAYSMTTRSGDYKYLGGISSIMIGAAPATAGDDMKVSFSDVKVYTLASASEFSSKIDTDLVLDDAAGVEVNGTVIEVSDQETVASLRAKYSDYAIAAYNADGTQPDATANFETGMSVKVVSNDGMQAKVFSINAEATVNQTEPESDVYTVDTEAKTVSKVAPLTKVSDFLGNFKNGSLMSVVNIDGSVMDADAYATENVALKAPNGDLYAIDVKYAYAPIQNSGAALADGTELYDEKATEADFNDIEGGFTKIQVYDKIGYGSEKTSPENTETQTVKTTKRTLNGEPVYEVENDSNKYLYLRSHYTESPNYSTTLNNAIDSWTSNPIITTVEFKADKLGNVSVFNNVPQRDSGKNMKKGDTGIDGLVYSAELTYIPTSVHFLEDGSVKLGGIYSNYSSSQRSPSQETDFTWEAGKEYTVSIVQRYLRGTRNAYVDGVYVNGVKIFPNAKTVGHADGRVTLQADGTFKIGTRSSDHTYGGGLSSIMIGTAPKTADENMKVSLSDVKVYSVAAYNPAKDATITLNSNNSTVVVDNDSAVITCVGNVTAEDLDTTAKIKVENGYVKAVSADGLVSKTYTVVSKSVKTAFLNGENGPEVETLAEVDSEVCFTALIEKNAMPAGVSPLVILSVYNKGQFVECINVTGENYNDEITKYKTVYDISGFSEDAELEIRGFVFDGFGNLKPLNAASAIK